MKNENLWKTYHSLQMSGKDSCTCKLRPEALTRSDILCLFGQGNITCNFIRVKSGNFEK